MIFEKERILLISPFEKVLRFLAKQIHPKGVKFELLQDKNIKALFEFKKLLDFRG